MTPQLTKQKQELQLQSVVASYDFFQLEFDEQRSEFQLVQLASKLTSSVPHWSDTPMSVSARRQEEGNQEEERAEESISSAALIWFSPSRDLVYGESFSTSSS
ncbi:hypothetical protein GUJ93_ZPchr0012g20898 [Zizania palustris]|uniref:Uncharacterized protein n=1 Tax=Zizania palustris TaxID=103762 RepID=A0A8J5WNZ5_ZIZPA|nr:hypothetical protein GUJ93_ZPchr0012g20898 [Zizania palustris]